MTPRVKGIQTKKPKLQILSLSKHCDQNARQHHETRLYTFDPLKPQFYVVNLGFTGVYIIFIFFAQKHRLWVGGSNE